MAETGPDEVSLYERRVAEVVSAARVAFMANRARKGGWQKPDWDPLARAEQELAEVRGARGDGHHVFELGDVLNFLAFERQHELERRGLA